MKRSTVVVILTLIGFVAFLLWTTLSAQKVECAVCVEFGGGRNCATATADDEKAASQTERVPGSCRLTLRVVTSQIRSCPSW